MAPLTNAERQARWQAKHKEYITRLEARVLKLEAELAAASQPTIVMKDDPDAAIHRPTSPSFSGLGGVEWLRVPLLSRAELIEKIEELCNDRDVTGTDWAEIYDMVATAFWNGLLGLHPEDTAKLICHWLDKDVDQPGYAEDVARAMLDATRWKTGS